MILTGAAICIQYRNEQSPSGKQLYFSRSRTDSAFSAARVRNMFKWETQCRRVLRRPLLVLYCITYI